MFDFVPRMVPADLGFPAAMVGVAWIGAHHVFVAPEIGERLAHLQHIPACIEGVATRDAERIAQHAARVAALEEAYEAQLEEARRRAEAVRAEIERNAALAGALVESFGLGDLVDAVDPDGTFRALAEQALPQVPDLEDLGIAPPSLPPAPEVMSEAGRAASCVVAAEQLLAAHAWDMTFYTASATLYAPDAIRTMPERMIEMVEAQ